MVLESLFNPFRLKKKPWQMFAAGALYSFVAIILAYLVFKEIAGILMVFLIVLAALPTLYTTIRNEEELDLQYNKESIKLSFLAFSYSECHSVWPVLAYPHQNSPCIRDSIAGKSYRILSCNVGDLLLPDFPPV